MTTAEPARESFDLEADELQRIASHAEYTVTTEANGFKISNGGEIRYAISFSAGEWTVTRAERSSSPTFEFASSSGAAVQRFMLMEFAGDIRQHRGLGRVGIEWEIVAPGFTLEERAGRLHVVGGSVDHGMFRLGNPPMGATRLSWIATADPAELLASLLRVDGSPLLAKWVWELPASLGCDQCRGYYLRGTGGTPAKLLLQNEGAGLLRCPTCETYWVEFGGKTAKAISHEDALKQFPALGYYFGHPGKTTPDETFQRQVWKGDVVLPVAVRYQQPDHYLHQVTVTFGRQSWTATGPDAFAALVNVRLQLEHVGISLAVEGARLHSYPSRMQRDMGGGTVVYRMVMGKRPDQDDVASIFDVAPADELGTVVEQESFFRAWLETPRAAQ